MVHAQPCMAVVQLLARSCHVRSGFEPPSVAKPASVAQLVSKGLKIPVSVFDSTLRHQAYAE